MSLPLWALISCPSCKWRSSRLSPGLAGQSFDFFGNDAVAKHAEMTVANVFGARRGTLCDQVDQAVPVEGQCCANQQPVDCIHDLEHRFATVCPGPDVE